MRSSALLPRRRVGACSPSTQRIASTTFDLPQPLGPTTAVAPGLKLITVASRKDLKPTNSRLLRRILPSPPPPHRPTSISHHHRTGSIVTQPVVGDKPPQPHSNVVHLSVDCFSLKLRLAVRKLLKGAVQVRPDAIAAV